MTKARPVRSLHVFGTLNRGGAETWLMDVVRRTDRERMAIDVCVIGDREGVYEEEFRSLGGRIFRCPLRRQPLRFQREFGRLLREHEFDVVHSHVYLFSGVVLRCAHSADVSQRVAHIHPIEDFKRRGRMRRWYTAWMRRWIEKHGTHFVAPTEDGLEKFWGPGWRDDGDKCAIYNGVSLSRFEAESDPAALRRELDLPPEAKIVLNVARFAPHKRQLFLADVAEEAVKLRDDTYFVLLGVGDLRDQTMDRVRQKGLDDRFRFVPGAPDIDRYWLSADAFAFPSVNEGFGIVVAEAAAAGLPVIAQDIPGVREAARACHDIHLLPLDTEPGEWAGTLNEAVGRGRLSRADRLARHGDFPFTIEKSVASLERLYGIPGAAD